MNEKKKRPALMIVFFVLIGVTLLLCGTVAALWLSGRSQLTQTVAAPQLPSPEEPAAAEAETPALMDSGIVAYNGKRYRYNDQMCNILLIGVDAESKPAEALTPGSDIQADLMVLAALDLKNDKLSVITINRDTMGQIQVRDAEGNSQGYSQAQLALSFSYGDGLEESCRLTCQAVSNLFYGLQIHGYAAYYMGGIADLNDALGGVTVTVLDDYPFARIGGEFSNMVAGEEVTLTGKQAWWYIQLRNMTADGNAQRMARQKQYMLAMMTQAMGQLRESPSRLFGIYDAVDDYLLTDLGLSRISYLATSAAVMDFSGDMQSVAGEVTVSEDRHVELHPDPEALYRQILSVFYEEVTE